MKNTHKMRNHALALVIFILSLLLFISWGPTHINFPWPTMFALCAPLYAAYFFIAKKNPTPYDLISSNQLPQSYQQNIIYKLQEKNVRVALMHGLHKNEKSIVANYIRKNYKKTNEISGFIVYKK